MNTYADIQAFYTARGRQWSGESDYGRYCYADSDAAVPGGRGV